MHEFCRYLITYYLHQLNEIQIYEWTVLLLLFRVCKGICERVGGNVWMAEEPPCPVSETVSPPLYCPAAASSNQWPVEGRPQIAIYTSTVCSELSITNNNKIRNKGQEERKV